MSDWEGLFDDSSEEESSFHGASSASGLGFSHSSSYQPGGEDSFLRTNQLSANPLLYTPQHASHASSVASTKSTSSKQISYTTCDQWVLGVSPRFPVSREPEPPLSSASSLNDPILRSFASHTPSASPATSAIRQPAGLDTPSSSTEATESDETDSYAEEPSLQEGDGELRTPATSNASAEADIIFALEHYQNHEDQVAVIPSGESLIGLQFPVKYRDPPSFYNPNDDDKADDTDDIDEFLRNGPTNLQARADARPWTADTEGLWTPDSEASALAPSPGPAFNKYYLRTRKYTRIHKESQRKRKAILASCEAEPTYVEPNTGTTECHQDATILGDCLKPYIESQCKRSTDWYNNNAGHFSGTVQQPNLYHPVQYVNYSPETLTAVFYPPFLVSHLSRSSVSTFTLDLYNPNDLVHNLEYHIDLSFHFGPPIGLDVCTFTPKDSKTIRSYQRHQGKNDLTVQDSLPIALNLFSVESEAEELDTWLEQIVGSKSRLSEYVDLMLCRQEGHQSPQILKLIVSWYLTSKKEFSKPADQILRVALKLLITTTLLSLVPKVTNLPESLLHYLSSQSHAATNISTDAPKLLTRQIKASIFHLQKDLLCDLFHHFSCARKLPAEVKVAVAILVAFVLDLVRHASQQFAKYSRTVNSTVDVKERDVVQYETNMQTQVFDRVRKSILNVATKRTGGLGERLRDLGSTMKGKEKETQDGKLLSVILDTVYRE